jgi:hypothetical protein
MRRALTTIAAIAVLVLAAKVLGLPSKTAADTHMAQSPTQNAMPIYDMHVGYSGMKNLRPDQIPAP